MFLSVIIPAYNEEKRIGKTLLAVDHYLAKQKFDYEILAIIDGATDKTAEVVNNFRQMVRNLRLIDNKQNHGKGWVVRQGMLEAHGEIRLFMDADNATTLDHFDKMLPLFRDGYEVVIGSRDSKDARGAKQAVPQPLFKRILGNAGNVLIQIFAVPGIWDTQCGFKAFSAKAAKAIFSKTRIDRWGMDIEILALARKLGFKIGKIPIYWVNDAASLVKLSGYLAVFKELFQIWWWLLTDKYNLKKIKNTLRLRNQSGNDPV